jgi:anti-sigma factor RsiW
MKCDEARAYFVDLWRGTLPEDGRAALSEHLAGCEACRGESAELGHLWTTLEAIPEPEPGPKLRREFYERLSGDRRREHSWHTFGWLYSPAFGALAAALLLAAGVGIGRLTSRAAATGNEPTVARLQDEIADMRQLVALSLMQQQSPSERIKGVSYAVQSDSDQKVLTALINAVNHDANVNVRLAAIDALRRFSSAPSVRLALPESLTRQDSPLVQIALLDNIVEIHDQSAAPAIQTLIEGPNVNPEVRQHANWALRQLE